MKITFSFCPFWRALKWIHGRPAWFASLDEDELLAVLFGYLLILLLWGFGALAFHVGSTHFSWVLSFVAGIGAVIAFIAVFIGFVYLFEGIGWLWGKAGVFLQSKVDECDRRG
jgi:hypothetical protein